MVMLMYCTFFCQIWNGILGTVIFSLKRQLFPFCLLDCLFCKLFFGSVLIYLIVICLFSWIGGLQNIVLMAFSSTLLLLWCIHIMALLILLARWRSKCSRSDQFMHDFHHLCFCKLSNFFLCHMSLTTLWISYYLLHIVNTDYL